MFRYNKHIFIFEYSYNKNTQVLLACDPLIVVTGAHCVVGSQVEISDNDLNSCNDIQGHNLNSCIDIQAQ